MPYSSDSHWALALADSPPAKIDPAAAESRLNEVLAALPVALGVPNKNIVLKQRNRQKGKSQYRKHQDSGEFFEVKEGQGTFLINVKDYLDQDNIISADFISDIYNCPNGHTIGGADKSMTYCGNDRTPYINEIKVRIVNRTETDIQNETAYLADPENAYFAAWLGDNPDAENTPPGSSGRGVSHFTVTSGYLEGEFKGSSTDYRDYFKIVR